MLDLMQQHLNRELLKYAAGRAITCPGCGGVMDCRRTVIITAGAREIVRCAECYDRAVAANVLPATVTVLDGRTVWPTKPKRAAKPKAPAKARGTRQKADKRHYPTFIPGMTTNEYIARFDALAQRDYIFLAPVDYTHDTTHPAPMLDPSVPESESFTDGE